MNDNDGNSLPILQQDGFIPLHYSMTKREIIASMAMQGLLSASPEWAGDPKFCASVAAAHAKSLMEELGCEE